jgi:hypothetical protein
LEGDDFSAGYHSSSLLRHSQTHLPVRLATGTYGITDEISDCGQHPILKVHYDESNIAFIRLKSAGQYGCPKSYPETSEDNAYRLVY